VKRWLGAILLWAVVVPAALALDARLPFRAFILDNWSVEQGLPQITALSIVQDRAGYLWIGTQIALARFDGVRFTTFDRDRAGVDTGSLVASWADRSGAVWFGGTQGLLRERNGRFENLGGDAVFAITNAGDDTPLLATSRGLARVRGEKIVPVAGYQGAAYSLLREHDTLWIGGEGRLCRTQFPKQSPPAPPHCIVVTAANGERPEISWIARAQGTLWLGTHGGLLRLDGEQAVPAALGDDLEHTGIEALYTDHDGMTNKLQNINAGDELIIHDVWGAINYKGPGLFIAGGAGVTPFIAILRQLHKDGNLKDCKLLFANKSSEDIILRKEFEGMLGENFINILDRSDDRNIMEGHIDKRLLAIYATDAMKYYYVCGPDKFVEVMVKYLEELGKKKEQIIIEE